MLNLLRFLSVIYKGKCYVWMMQPTERKKRGGKATQFKPKPDSLAEKPISVYLEKRDDEAVRSLPNRSEWLRTVIHAALIAEGLIHE